MIQTWHRQSAQSVLFCALLLLCACGGSLSSEQRKKIRENMEAKAIKKISDAELTEAAFVYARALGKTVADKQGYYNKKFLDSLGRSHQVQIFIMRPSDSLLRKVEKMVIEAYTSGADVKDLGDNLQRMGTDSLLYTRPLMKERPDGSMEFDKALAIRIPKKQVILSIKE